MCTASSCVFSATDSSPGAYIVDVSSDQGCAAFRLPRLRRTVRYICRRSGSVYRCVSSKTANVSLPPSFDALDAVDGTISPPCGSRTRV
jgi:hypothetical protein